MRALWIEAGRAVVRDDVPPVASAPGESRVRVLRAGVCATDLALMAGYMGFTGVPGHEFVGVALDGPLAGQRVVGEINAGCGHCADCLGGDSRHCGQRTVLGILGRSGAMAEECRLPDRCLWPVPAGISDDAATFVEPLAAAYQILAEVPEASAGRVLVVGDGRLGLLCAQVLAIAGAEVSMFGRHPERASRLACLLPWLAEPRQGTWDVVVEASGDPAVLARALAWVRPRGTLILKTTSARGVELDLAPLVVNELKLVGSRCGPYGPALDALEAGLVRPEALVDARYPLAEGATALGHAGRRGTLKVLIDVGA